MDIVDVVRTLKSSKIFIPSHHQGPLFMKEGSSFTSVLLLGNHRDHHADGSKHWPQILISPFPLADWDTLWRITFSIKDRNGILHEISKILGIGDLNILSEVSRPVNLNQDQQVQMVVSSKGTHNRLETMQRIKEHLVVQYFREFHIEQIDGVEPTPIFMDRLDKYQGLFEDFGFELNHSTQILKADKAEVLTAERAGKFSLNRNLYLEIPEVWREALEDVNGYSRNQKMTYLLHTNSSHQLLSIYFPPESKRLWNIRIECADTVGAIATFTRILKAEINLVSTSLAKLDNDRSRIDLVCEFAGPSEDDLGSTIVKAFEDSIEDVLRYKPILSTLGVVDSSSRITTSEWRPIWDWRDKGQPQTPYNNHIEIAPHEREILYPTKENDTDKIRRNKLKQEVEDLYEELKSMPPNEDEEHKINQLIAIGQAMLSRGFLKEKKIFLSYKYKENDPAHELMIEEVKKTIRAAGFGTVWGDKPPETGPYSETLVIDIKRKIDSCPYFIAILTPDEARTGSIDAESKKAFPSDWVVWEYGYAEKSARLTRVIREAYTDLPRPFLHLTMPVFSYPNSPGSAEKLKELGRIIDNIITYDFEKNWRDRYRDKNRDKGRDTDRD